MSLPFKVGRILRNRDWGPFYKVLSNRQSTIDIAHRWLVKHGYSISRGAVGNYRRAKLANHRHSMRTDLRLTDDAQTRRKIKSTVDELDSIRLAALAMFAVFLISGPIAKPQDKKVTAGRRPNTSIRR